MVSHTMLKRYPLEEEWEEEAEEEDANGDWELVEEEEREDRDDGKEEVVEEEFSEDELKRKGRYVVEGILKHKFMGEWKFLVKWAAPWTLRDATWEPIESFVTEEGYLNENFIDYCKEKKLDEIMAMAQRKATKQGKEKERTGSR